jgi:hypothetical protein
MKKTLTTIACAAVLATSLVALPAVADGGHSHGPQYGGVVREVKSISYELVAKPDTLTLYLSDHGKPISTQGAKAEATLYAGNEKTTVMLESNGDNQMSAAGNFKVGVGVRAVVQITRQGQETTKVDFKLK